jgi:oligoendopeptidase F
MSDGTSPRLEPRAQHSHSWDLTPLFANWQQWRECCSRLTSLIHDYEALRGSLAGGPAQLALAFKLAGEVGAMVERVCSYAALAYHRDHQNQVIYARLQQADKAHASWVDAQSWFAPEVLRIASSTLREWLTTCEELALYRFAVDRICRNKIHILSESSEMLISTTVATGEPARAYIALSTMDFECPTVRLSGGETVALSRSRYDHVLMTEPSQADRSAAYHAFHRAYAKNINTYAALYRSILQRDWSVARARRYTTSL